MAQCCWRLDFTGHSGCGAGAARAHQGDKRRPAPAQPDCCTARDCLPKTVGKDQLAAMEKAAADARERRTGKRELDEIPNFGGGWQGDAMRRQYELDQAMGRSWN